MASLRICNRLAELLPEGDISAVRLMIGECLIRRIAADSLEMRDFLPSRRYIWWRKIAMPLTFAEWTGEIPIVIGICRPGG
jgi:hypothetical protein